MCEHGNVCPVYIGKDIKTKYGLALTITNLHLVKRAAAATLHHRAVLSLKGRNPDSNVLLPTWRRRQGGIRRGLNKNLSTDSMVFRVQHSMPIRRSAAYASGPPGAGRSHQNLHKEERQSGVWPNILSALDAPHETLFLAVQNVFPCGLLLSTEDHKLPRVNSLFFDRLSVNTVLS